MPGIVYATTIDDICQFITITNVFIVSIFIHGQMMADSLITNLFDDLLAENSLLLRYYFGVDKKLR